LSWNSKCQISPSGASKGDEPTPERDKRTPGKGHGTPGARYREEGSARPRTQHKEIKKKTITIDKRTTHDQKTTVTGKMRVKAS